MSSLTEPLNLFLLTGSKAYIGSSTMFMAFPIGTALSPNLVAFFIFRALTACQVAALLIVGPTLISDIYHPVSLKAPVGKGSNLADNGQG